MMSQMIMRFLIILNLALLPYTDSMFNSQPQFTIKAENNKAFDESCLIGHFDISKGNIADCLERCLENCSCQSFQVCQNTQCQLCSSNKEDNSSLVRDKNDCVYAMHEMRYLTESFQKIDDQCSGMSCSMKYNCCHQSGLCPNNKICKPVYKVPQPWKRYTCECPDGYHGSNCEQPITSCQGYSNRSPKSGIYKIRDSMNSMYEVYCDFDSVSAWTLVQSASFANGSYSSKFKQFRKQLSKNAPVNENTPIWSGYRLSKARMHYIQKYSVLLRFTCDYEKHYDVEKSDYVDISLRQQSGENVESINVIELTKVYRFVFPHRGQIGETQLNECKILLYQGHDIALHININATGTPSECNFIIPAISGCSTWTYFNYFGQYWRSCLDEKHSCAKSDSSTTQIWFGN